MNEESSFTGTQPLYSLFYCLKLTSHPFWSIIPQWKSKQGLECHRKPCINWKIRLDNAPISNQLLISRFVWATTRFITLVDTEILYIISLNTFTCTFTVCKLSNNHRYSTLHCHFQSLTQTLVAAILAAQLSLSQSPPPAEVDLKVE